jgi:amino acid transporter
MAEQKELPQIIGKVHRRFATPYTAILMTSSLMLLMTLKSSFVAALTISAIARLVTYAATCGGLLLFRNRADAPYAQFHLPAGKLIAALSLVLIVWLLANSTGQEALTAAIVGTVGLLIFFSYRFYSRPS